jgi:hypothetical protein
VVLSSGGSVSKDDADRHAKAAYKSFGAERNAQQQAQVERDYAELRKSADALPAAKRAPRKT